MRGHEYIREAIRTHLEDKVPARLTAHLTAYGLASPSVADLRSYPGRRVAGHQRLPGDHRPVDGLRGRHPHRRMAPGGSLRPRVIVACDHRVHGDARGRRAGPRPGLAGGARVHLQRTGLTEDIDISPRKRPEATGAAAETRAGVPLAAGTLKFRASVLETWSTWTRRRTSTTST